MDFGQIFWLFFVLSALQPVLKQRLLENSRQRLLARLERQRKTRVILLVHRQETMSLLGFPLMRYIDINDSEDVIRACVMTDPEVPVDLVLHTPGGLVLATEFQWRRPPTPEARQAFLGEVCPGMLFDTVEDWLARYRRAGLAELQVTTGPFEMMTPGGFLADEGLTNSIRVMSRAMSNPVARRRMFWLMPRISRAVPFLGYVLIRGQKPAAG